MTLTRLIGGFDKAIFVSLCALIYFLPISIALVETFSAFVVFFYLLKRGALFYDQIQNGSIPLGSVSLLRRIFLFFQSFKPAENFLNRPIAIFLFFTFMSVIFSQIPLLSLRGYVGKTLEFVFLYFSFLECMNSKRRIKIFLTVYFISFALICINGIFQYFAGWEFIHGHLGEGGRIFSSLRQSNDFGAYLIIFIPVLFFLSVFSGGKRTGMPEKPLVSISLIARVAMSLLFIVSLACLGLTFSRGAWLAFVLSLFLAGCKKLKFFIPCCILIVTFLGTATPNLKERGDGMSQYINRFMKAANQDDRKAVLWQFIDYDNNRMVYWRGTKKIIKDYPFFGTGLNTYSQIVGRYKDTWGGYAHNCYLQMTVETGLFGIMSFLWVLFVFFRNSLKGLRLIEDQVHWVLLFGFLTGLLAFLIHSFVDTNFYSTQLASLMWIIMGVIVALQKINEDKLRHSN